MQHKCQIISGRIRPRILTFFQYLLLLSLVLCVVHYFNRNPKISNTSNNNLQQEIRNASPKDNSYQWQDYFPIYRWNYPWKDENEEEQNDCNFKDYVFGQRVKQTDPCLIIAFKKLYLLPPPSATERNNSELVLTQEISSNIEKLKWVQRLVIEDMRNPQRDSRWPGFFIECGANDGQFISPTNCLERKYNWTGLLVEANPTPFKKLQERKRNAWAANVAACPTEYPEQLVFYTHPTDMSTEIAGLHARPQVGITANLTVQCIPLYTMLAALAVSTVDYFSLDVEGFELAVLKTIPYEKVWFKVMTVEYSMIPGKQEALRQFLEPRGYRFVKNINDHLTEDCLFVHETLYERASKVKI